MNDKAGPASALRDYMGFDGRTLGIFSGLVTGVVVVVTCIYVSIFGFDDWKSNMSQASSMMLSNFNAPGTEAPATAGPAGSVGGGFVPAAGQAGAQFSCPTCGAVGLPVWSPDGAPRCPACGAVMTVTGNAGGQTHLAAQP